MNWIEHRTGSIVRLLALLATLLLLTSFLSILHTVIGTVRDPWVLYPVAGVAFLAATVLARRIQTDTAVWVALGTLALGLLVYLLVLPYDPSVVEMALHNVELLTGQTVLQIRAVDVWALAVTPAPVFATWFLALRRRYVAGAVAGGLAVGYLVLTGDAGTTTTLLAVVSVGALVGFGDLERPDSSFEPAQQIATVLAIMVLAPLVVTIIPGGAATPLTFVSDGGNQTMEESVVSTAETLDIQGSVDQSPDVRFYVESESPQYWKTGSFDRYTGDGWVRTGGDSAYHEDRLDRPPSQTDRITQRVEAATELAVLPATWRPVQVDDSIADRTRVTESGDLALEGTLESGDSYEVISERPTPWSEDLLGSMTDYPDEITERYTQVPDSTPDRVGELTEAITEDADDPHETAVTIEHWLESEREYSLDVDRPDGDIADAFLFEMEAGYCTYYATTMVTMLRTQGIPARLAVGYTPGEEVDDDRYAVRGLNSHAWVEVYYPDVGWIQFDPTPAAERGETELDAIEQAPAEEQYVFDIEDVTDDEQADEPDAETDRSDEHPIQFEPPELRDDGPEDPTTDPTIPEGVGPEAPENLPPEAIENTTAQTSETDDAAEAVDDGEPRGLLLPVAAPGQQLALGAIVLLGLIASVRQSRTISRIGSRIRFRFRHESDPETAIEDIHSQLLLILERRYRPRRRGETMQSYLDAVDAGYSARQLARIRERARYAGEATPEDADEALELLTMVRKSNKRGIFR